MNGSGGRAPLRLGRASAARWRQTGQRLARSSGRDGVKTGDGLLRDPIGGRRRPGLCLGRPLQSQARAPATRDSRSTPLFRKVDLNDLRFLACFGRSTVLRVRGRGGSFPSSQDRLARLTGDAARPGSRHRIRRLLCGINAEEGAFDRCRGAGPTSANRDRRLIENAILSRSTIGGTA